MEIIDNLTAVILSMRPETLPVTLVSILMSSALPKCVIIVNDSGVEYGGFLRQIFSGLEDAGVAVQLEENQFSGHVTVAKNYYYQKAQTPYVLALDDDVAFSPTMIGSLANRFSGGDGTYVVPTIFMPRNEQGLEGFSVDWLDTMDELEEQYRPLVVKHPFAMQWKRVRQAGTTWVEFGMGCALFFQKNASVHLELIEHGDDIPLGHDDQALTSRLGIGMLDTHEICYHLTFKDSRRKWQDDVIRSKEIENVSNKQTV